ncbi:MAG: glycosyltransferase family 39 protein [Candidatus Pacebacteria bacterium]|nr:glycosyltransferase family 39 protein [Candidatus Paceibacterota bacterium]
MKPILNFFKAIYEREKYLTFLIFFLSIICSLLFLIFFKNIGPSEHQIPGSDYFAYYEPLANSILSGRGFVIFGKVPLNVGPIYPIFLSGILMISRFFWFDKFFLITIFNVILAAASSCFLFLLAREIFNKKIALLSSILWMSYPFNLWFIKNPNTEVPFIPLLYFGIFLYILAAKKKDLKIMFFSGLILGLSSLARLINLFLPLALFLFIFFLLEGELKKKKLIFATVFLLGAVISFLPWGLYTFAKTGNFIPFSHIASKGIIQGFVTLSREGKGVGGKADVVLEEVKAVDALGNETGTFYFLIRTFFKNPFVFIKLIGLKMARSWYATYMMWWESAILAVQMVYISSSLFGLIYCLKKCKDKIKHITLILIIIFYFWAIDILTGSILRYMVPAMGILIIFSAITISLLLDKIRKKFQWKQNLSQ